MRNERYILYYPHVGATPSHVKRVFLASRINCQVLGVTRTRARKQVLIQFNLIRFLPSILEAFVIPRPSRAFLILATRGRNKTKHT